MYLGIGWLGDECAPRKSIYSVALKWLGDPFEVIEMYNILKTANRTAKTDDNVGPAVLGTPYVGYFSRQLISV